MGGYIRTSLNGITLKECYAYNPIIIDYVRTSVNTALPLRVAESKIMMFGQVSCVMKLTRPHRFANRVGGEGRFVEECPPCKLIDVGNAKRYRTCRGKAAILAAPQRRVGKLSKIIGDEQFEIDFLYIKIKESTIKNIEVIFPARNQYIIFGETK